MHFIESVTGSQGDGVEWGISIAGPGTDFKSGSGGKKSLHRSGRQGLSPC